MQQVTDPSSLGHCCGVGLIPGPGSSGCYWWGQKTERGLNAGNNGSPLGDWTKRWLYSYNGLLSRNTWRNLTNPVLSERSQRKG